MAARSSGIEELINGWRTLSGWSMDFPDNNPGHRTWNRLVDRLVKLQEQALADPALTAALEEVARSENDPFVRDQARQALDPGVPFDDDKAARERWARHPKVGLSSVELRWRPGLLLAPPRRSASRYDSRLLGVPTGPLEVWPRRSDGLPLALLLDVDLGELSEFGDLGIGKLLGLPFSGRLQLFHDLKTWGHDPADGPAGAWLVRHVPEPTSPVAAPDDMDADSNRPAVAVRLLPFTAVEPTQPLTVTTSVTFEHAERRLIATILRQDAKPGTIEQPPSDTDLDRDPEIGLAPRLLGLAQLEPDDNLWAALHAARPTVDDWQLLAGIPGVDPFDHLFGDLGHLEVWCPAADLAAGRLDTAWCVIRR